LISTVQDGDDDYEESSKRKKKASKKRTQKGERKKEKKKKKKKKGQSRSQSQSAEESDAESSRLSQGEELAKEDEDFNPSTGKRSSRRAKPSRSNPSTPQQSSNSNMPTIDEVCDMFGVTDVHIDYTDADYANLISYKLYDKQIRPILQKENPKVSLGIEFVSYSYHSL